MRSSSIGGPPPDRTIDRPDQNGGAQVSQDVRDHIDAISTLMTQIADHLTTIDPLFSHTARNSANPAIVQMRVQATELQAQVNSMRNRIHVTFPQLESGQITRLDTGEPLMIGIGVHNLHGQLSSLASRYREGRFSLPPRSSIPRHLAGYSPSGPEAR